MPGKQWSILVLGSIALVLLLLAGCDPTTRHKVLTTIFDGVPSPLPPEQVLEDYYRQRLAAEAEQAAQTNAGVAVGGLAIGSRHRPYTEKKCTDCHDFSSAVGLVRPPRELCVMCHRDFVLQGKGLHVHGPVAIGDCSACHLPHTSVHGSLLEQDKTDICSKCHQEQRLAALMHDRVVTRGMACTDCHDPHYGAARYFLK